MPVLLQCFGYQHGLQRGAFCCHLEVAVAVVPFKLVVKLDIKIVQPFVFEAQFLRQYKDAAGLHARVNAVDDLIALARGDELQGEVENNDGGIRNGDILVMTVAVSTAGSIALISDIFWRMLYWGALTGGGASHRRRSNNNNGGGGGANPVMIIGLVLVLVLAPLAAALLKAAISRNREALADATAVKFTR